MPAAIDRCAALVLLVISVYFPWEVFAQSLPVRLGDLDADNQPTVLDLVTLINHINSTIPLSDPLIPYGDINEDNIINETDVDLLADAILGTAPLPNPFAAPVVSAPVTSTNGSSIQITGISRPNRTILVQGGLDNVIAVADSAGLFTVDIPLQPNRLNTLFLTARTAPLPLGFRNPCASSRTPNRPISASTSPPTTRSSPPAAPSLPGACATCR